MRKKAIAWTVLGVLVLMGCGDPDGSAGPGANGGSGAAASGSGGNAGSASETGGGGSVSGGSGGASGSSSTGGSGGTAPSGGSAGAGGGGTGGAGGTGLGGGGPIEYALDCGTSGIVLEGHGPPENRINYTIVGDGYNAADLETVYPMHLEEMLNGHGTPGSQGYVAGRFAPESEPYKTYRNFINICALKVESVDSGIVEGNGEGYGVGCTGAPNTAFDGCGNDSSRLGYITNDKVYDAVEAMMPATTETDWVAVVMNDSEWWNSGGIPMVWSGGHGDAALAASHEGGHGFFHLGDEYGNCGGNRINVASSQDSGGKWNHWVGFDQTPGTGEQGAFECEGSGNYRPSDASVMNSLWESAWLNSISLEQAVRDIYEIVDPIDSSTAATTTTPMVLEVKVIDPAVIAVDWTVDGNPAGSGATFDATTLPSGAHEIVARAHDDTPWVPMDTPHGREELEQTVEWTITVP
jgi:hypothetical protein